MYSVNPLVLYESGKTDVDYCFRIRWVNSLARYSNLYFDIDIELLPGRVFGLFVFGCFNTKLRFMQIFLKEDGAITPFK